MSELTRFLSEVFSKLDSAGVDYMITGSLASTYYSEPRTTQDVDLIVTAQPENLIAFADSLDKEKFYVESNEFILSNSQFNVVDMSSNWKLDLIARKDRPFSVTEFARRLPVELFGIATHIATAEDIILAKLEWAKLGESERQIRDISSIIEVQGAALDVNYLNEWATELGLAEKLNELLGASGS